ncbi:hypothetical protein DNTS_028685 [Danionella cerebrum]|uniref:tRNA-splicing endonuclease subunit Sen54 N-terminal domain-containing protein n=1 Tax=Danionella cerebrum TaxID=2873325 RepID=A0A553RLK1_9TELE|nr:hypothetical protein DNTS_028685 [Danionella translucida]
MADSDCSTDASTKHRVLHELLSPSELFVSRGTRSHRIPVRGQKDFVPNDSERQKKRLEKSLEDHWSLLSEERVERLGNLVRAVWFPEDKLVELQSPAGKFWQTMGFSERGKQYLYPEEALYLMECGSVQVFYQDLPLSIQEGYEHFLSSETLTLHHSAPSTNESPGDQQRKQQKRKRSESPEARDGSKRLVEQNCSAEIQTGAHLEPSTASSLGRLWWAESPVCSKSPSKQSSAPRWDFSRICFPDLGSSRGDRAPLSAPESSLLPGQLQVGECDTSHWRERINLKRERVSKSEREQENQKRREGSRRDINSDPAVQHCSSWAEFTQLMEERRRRHRRSREGQHLWESEPTPLSRPGQSRSHRDLLDQISIIKSSSLSEGVSRLCPSEQWKISFDVYQPDTVSEFKKRQPGKPYTRMCVCSFSAPVPDLHALKLVSFQSGDVPVTFAVVDHGDVSFYCFKDFKLPTDVYSM